MITSIANNIGIDQVSFKDYQTEKLTILNGKFTVDSTSAAWKAANEIVFSFESLTMAKPAISAVYMIDTQPRDQYDKAKRGTILKSWIKNNKLHIEKVDYFDDYGPITIAVANAYATGAQRTQVTKDGYVTTDLANQPTGTRLDRGCLMVKDHYIFCQMMFKQFYGIDETTEQAFDITNMPTDVDVYLPIAYSNSYIDNRGAPLSLAHLSDGHLTCTNPEDIGFVANSGTFFQFFAVRDVESQTKRILTPKWFLYNEVRSFNCLRRDVWFREGCHCG